MAGRTKLILVTSNEDILQEFSFDKATNTRIIDLDDDDDQIVKRTLDLFNQQISKKTMATKCVICGHRAIGFNYDVLSCASCKAFFRRNAHRNLKKMQCLKDDGQCSVAYGTRHKWQKCRLERCFAMGMRIEFFQSEEQKERRRKKVREDQTVKTQRSSTTNSESGSSSDEIDRLLIDTEKFDGVEEISFGTLSVEDWITIQNAESAFLSSFDDFQGQYIDSIDLTNLTSALVSWSEFGNQLSLRLINFSRQIDEFQGLLLDDRLILTKFNLFPLYPMIKVHKYKSTDNCFSHDYGKEPDEQKQFLKLCEIPQTIRHAFVDLVLSLVGITGQNPTILSLLLIILLLTPGLSMDEEQPPLNDPLSVNRVQCHYIRLFWNYLVYQFGELQARKRFIQLFNVILRMQVTSKTLRRFFRDHCIRSNTVDKLAPLMQSVLNIS